MTVVLDAGALIALERRDRRMLALADELLTERRLGFVPAGVVAQVWRGSPRQHAVRRLLTSNAMRIDPLTADVAYQLGRLLADTDTSDPTDAHVAWLGIRLSATVITSDPRDLTAIAPKLRLITV